MEQHPPLILTVLAVAALAPSVAAGAPRPGSIDRSFGGGDGRVRLKLSGERIWPSAWRVQPDGKLVVIGSLLDGVFEVAPSPFGPT